MIYVECDADFALAKVLARGKPIIHSPPKPEVCIRLENSKRSKGMVDEDPGHFQPPYIKRASTVESISEQGLKVLYYKSSGNTLILICPTLEVWILEAAHEAKVNIKEKYHLPSDAGELHDVLTLKRQRQMEDYKRLISVLTKSSARVKTLRDLLNKKL